LSKTPGKRAYPRPDHGEFGQQWEPLYTSMHQNILDVFNEHGVQIMTPAYEEDPDVPKVVPGDQWYLPPAKSSAAPASDGRKPGVT